MSYELPEGVKHYQTSGWAETEEAYAALTADEGWEERSATQSNREVETTLCWKEKYLIPGDSRLTVFAPRSRRNANV